MFIFKTLVTRITLMYIVMIANPSFSMDIKSYEVELTSSVRYHATTGASLGLGVSGLFYVTGMGGLFIMMTVPIMGGLLGVGYGGYRNGLYHYHEIKQLLITPQKPTYLEEMTNAFLRVPQLTLGSGVFVLNYTKRIFFER